LHQKCSELLSAPNEPGLHSLRTG